MGWFKDLFTSEEEKIIQSKYGDKMPDGLKWIFVSLVVNFEGPSKKEIEKIALDITNIINNTHGIVNEQGEYAGYTNPYLGMNLASGSALEDGKIRNIVNLYSRVPIPKATHKFFPKGFPRGKELLVLSPSRPFYPVIEKEGKKWKIIFVASKTSKKDKTNLHSIENLSNDLWVLAGASNLICERYNLPIPEERPTYNPIMLSGYPAIELHDHLLVIKYHVHDRLASAVKNPELDKAVLGNGETILDVIKKVSKTQPNSVWAKDVKKLL